MNKNALKTKTSSIKRSAAPFLKGRKVSAAVGKWARFMPLLCLPLLLFVMGNRAACDRRTPTLTCNDFAVTIAPGECVDITNPCDASGDFARFDGFRLCDEPDGIFVRTSRSRAGVTRQICAAPDVAIMTNEPVTYVYSAPPPGQGVAELGEATVYVTTGTIAVDPLELSVSAVPTEVANPGDATQLFADVTGGTSPYTFLWTADPQSGNPMDAGMAPGDETLQNPWAAPMSPTEYAVVVTDADGETVSGSVQVSVGFTVWAAADPTHISADKSTQLTATVVGGTPPYQYSWGGQGLSDPSIADPVATPTQSGQYQVWVFDSVGNFAVHSVDVTVAMVVTVNVAPTVIDFGGYADLAVMVQGGAWPYTYQWTPADGLHPNDHGNPYPTVRPATSVTYQVTVTDANGDEAEGSAYLHVNVHGPVHACFSVTPDPPDLEGTDELWDASCSFGEGTLQFRWVFTCPYEAPCTKCFGANAEIKTDGSATPHPSDCDSVTFHPDLQTLRYPFEPPQQFRQVTLIVEDTSTGIRDGVTVLYSLF